MRRTPMTENPYQDLENLKAYLELCDSEDALWEVHKIERLEERNAALFWAEM